MSGVGRAQAILLSAQVARLLIFLSVAGLLARRLTPQDFGFVALVTSAYLIGQEVLEMGTTAIAVRDIAARPDTERDTLAAVLALRRLLATFPCVGILALAASDPAVSATQRLALVVVAIGLFVLHLNTYHLALQVRQSFGAVTLLGITSHAAFLAVSVYALDRGAGGATIATLIVARESLLLFGVRRLAVRSLGYRLHPPWIVPGAWGLLREGWILGMAGVLYKLATFAGGFLLWSFSTPEAVAGFSAAQRLLVPATDMAWLYVTPLIAALGALAASDPRRLRQQVAGYAKLLVGASALMAACGYHLAPLILAMIYGESYVNGPGSAVGAFRWLLAAGAFALVTPVLAVAEIAHGNARALLATAGACLAIELAGAAWAIPRHGSDGAAMALCVAECCVCLTLLSRSVARAELRPDRSWLGYLVPAIGLAVALSLLSDSPVMQMIVACTGAPAAMMLLTRLPAQRVRRAGTPDNGAVRP